MDLKEFHRSFRSDLQAVIAERVESGRGPFPSEELVFAEIVMDHISEAGICDPATVCSWNGRIGNSILRISGFAISSDRVNLDVFVTHYFGDDELRSLRDSVAGKTASRTVRFLLEAAGGRLEARIDPTHPIRDLVSTIRSTWSILDRLRVFVITDGYTKSKQFVTKEVHGKNVLVEAMDIERLFRHTIRKPRDELALSFVQSIGHPLPCVHIPNPGADYEYAMTAIPGSVVRDLYLRFGPRLLEANVRTYLGGRRKVNKGIIETLRNEPEHFLAFNNGLVIVCDEAAFEETHDGYFGISFLKGLQVVNGGQTTSSIYFSCRDNMTIDLSNVMVPAKIVILGDSNDDARERLISKVSRFSNSQTAIRVSDLSANRPFHIELEKLANQTWCPDGATRWFYERAAGAYNVMLMRQGNTPAKRRRLIKTTPRRCRLTKSDVARYHEAWRQKPAQVALGAEKNFAEFMNAIDKDPTIVPSPLTSSWYREMIAKSILFKEIEKLVRARSERHVFRQGWVNIATYTVSVVSHRIGDDLDLETIWMQQSVSVEMQVFLLKWAKVVSSVFEKIAPGEQYSEVAKRADTWSKVARSDYPSPRPDMLEIREQPG